MRAIRELTPGAKALNRALAEQKRTAEDATKSLRALQRNRRGGSLLSRDIVTGVRTGECALSIESTSVGNVHIQSPAGRHADPGVLAIKNLSGETIPQYSFVRLDGTETVTGIGDVYRAYKCVEDNDCVAVVLEEVLANELSWAVCSGHVRVEYTGTEPVVGDRVASNAGVWTGEVNDNGPLKVIRVDSGEGQADAVFFPLAVDDKLVESDGYLTYDAVSNAILYRDRAFSQVHWTLAGGDIYKYRAYIHFPSIARERIASGCYIIVRSTRKTLIEQASKETSTGVTYMWGYWIVEDWDPATVTVATLPSVGGSLRGIQQFLLNTLSITTTTPQPGAMTMSTVGGDDSAHLGLRVYEIQIPVEPIIYGIALFECGVIMTAGGGNSLARNSNWVGTMAGTPAYISINNSIEPLA